LLYKLIKIRLIALVVQHAVFGELLHCVGFGQLCRHFVLNQSVCA